MSEAQGIRAAFRGRLGAFFLDAAFTIPGAGFTGLFGPSGCGKTAVLRCIAGLQRLEGSFAIDGDTWQDDATFRQPHARAVGYVFQEASLFPHLSVRRNLLYGAPRRRAEAQPEAIAFAEVVELLGLGALLERAPQNLSGGERQRVAVGRALLSQPKLLLMDEPLSALDRATRDEILPFLERLHERLALPVLYVSHDMAELERLADHLVLMQAGRVVASGPLAALQSDPALPLAAAHDAAVGLDATVESHDAEYGLAALRVEGGRFLVPSPPLPTGEHRRIRVAASEVSLACEAPRATTILNVLPCRIVSLTRVHENEVVAVLALGADGAGARLLARITRRSAERLGLAAGMAVYAQVKAVAFELK